MNRRLLLACAVALAVAGCGVKSDLQKPNNQPAKKNEKDSSKPPAPLGK